ncbi:MAG: DUF4159 domain-containing protein, partial [Phycisphaeraceae bacterium]
MNQAAERVANDVPIGELPTAPSLRKAVVVSCATMMLGLLGVAFWQIGPDALAASLETNAPVEIYLDQTPSESISYAAFFALWFVVFGVIGMGCIAAGLMSLLRNRATYQLLRVALAFVYPASLGYVVAVWLALFGMLRDLVPIDGGLQDRATTTLLWWNLCWPVLAVVLYTGWLHVMLWSRSVNAAFTRQAGQPMRGDQILEDWRTHGKDPRARRSLYGSFATHVFVIILIPLLLQSRGCVEAYRVPQGSGEPAVAQVKVVKQKKEKKKLTLRPNSAIIFDIPDLDDTEVDKLMEQMTQATYEASVNAKAGKLGKGGGKQGGWPEGMEDYKIRFIRLDHGGDGWDDGMNQTDADINFLNAFAKATGFDRIASKGESHAISLLDKYPEDGFPPFVYFTGNGGIGRTNSKDLETLREYCLGGGMLIADAGSASFDRSFRQFIGKVFPDKPLLDIADDDMLYQLPYGFPNGAPAFWAHGGRRAKGIKHDGRWIVFYHPGDMNDAWKSPGYSDVTPEMRDAATQLGVNLVYYAFNQWNDA